MQCVHGRQDTGLCVSETRHFPIHARACLQQLFVSLFNSLLSLKQANENANKQETVCADVQMA